MSNSISLCGSRSPFPKPVSCLKDTASIGLSSVSRFYIPLPRPVFPFPLISLVGFPFSNPLQQAELMLGSSLKIKLQPRVNFVSNYKPVTHTQMWGLVAAWWGRPLSGVIAFSGKLGRLMCTFLFWTQLLARKPGLGECVGGV